MYGRFILDISLQCATFRNVDDLVKASCNVNGSVKGLLPFIHIVTYTNVQFVSLLIERGTDINNHDAFGNVPFIVSVNCSNIGAVRCSIDN